VLKYGVNYRNSSGVNVLSLALTAKNIDLVKACIKDGADLISPITNEYGNERIPLAFVIISADPDFNQANNYPIAKMLVDSGAALQVFQGFNSRKDILLEAVTQVNQELFDLVFPKYNKTMLDFTSDEVSDTFMNAYIANILGRTENDSFNQEDPDKVQRCIEMLKKIVNKGLKLNKAQVDMVLEREINETSNTEVVKMLKSCSK
jgi:hypothetical protein